MPTRHPPPQWAAPSRTAHQEQFAHAQRQAQDGGKQEEITSRRLSEFLGPAGWSSLVARQAHNLKVVGSNPTPATKNDK